MEAIFDKDVQSVLIFMQSNVPGEKLLGLAEALPVASRLLWGHYRQEPFIPLKLDEPKILP